MKKFAITLFCALAFFLLLPTLLSTHFLKERTIVPLIRSYAGGDLQIGEVDLSWFRAPRFKGIRWTEGGRVVEVEELRILPSFLSISHLKAAKGEAKITELNGEITREVVNFLGKSTGGTIEVKGTPEKFTFFLENFPTALLDDRAEEIVGEELSVNGEFLGDSAKLDLRSKRLNGSGYVSLGGGIPKDGVFTLTPNPALLSDYGIERMEPITLRFPRGDEIKGYAQSDLIQLNNHLTFHFLDASFHFTPMGQTLEYTLKGQLIEGGVTANLKGTGTQFLQNPEESTLALSGENVPASLLALLLAEDSKLLALKEAVNGIHFSFQATTIGKNIELEGKFDGGAISLIKLERKGKGWELQSPAKVDFTLAPSLFLKKQGLPLSEKVGAVLVLDELSFPENTRAKGSIFVKEATLQFEDPLGKVQGERLLLNFLAKSPQEIALKGSGGAFLLGESVEMEGEGLALLDEEFHLAWQNSRFRATSRPFIAQLEQRENGDFSGTFSASITPEMSKRLNLSSFLVRPMTATLALDGYSPATGDAQGTLFIDEVRVSDLFNRPEGGLENVKLPFSYDSEKKTLFAEISGDTAAGPEGLNGSVKIVNFFEHPLFWAVEGDAKIRRFSTLLLHHPLATEVLGNEFDLDLTIREALGEETVDFTLQSEILTLKGGLLVDESIRLKSESEPLDIRWNLDPARLERIRELLPFLSKRLALTQNFSVEGKVWELNLPVGNLAAGALSVKVNTGPLSFVDQQSQKPFTTTPIAANFHSKQLSSGYLFDVAMTDLLVQGEVKGADINLKGSATNVPLILLGNLFVFESPILGQVEAIIGEKLSANFHLFLENYAGAVDLNLAGDHGKMNLNGEISPQGLTLRGPLLAEFSLTPSIVHSFLDEIFPLLRSAIGSEAPVRIAVQAEGFFYPLWTHDTRQIRIPAMSIDLGKIYFKNDEQIGELLNLLSFQSPENHVLIWFTPLYLSMQDGIVNIQRVDMLIAGLFPVASWGTVDLVRDQVNMKVGLGGITLARSFHLKGIPKNYYLQLSLKGTTSSASVNKNKASTKIAALVAKLKSTPQGAIVGGILDVIGGGWGQKKTPKPTTQPFPWETN